MIILNKFMRKIFVLYSKLYGVFASSLYKYLPLFPSKVTFKITNICNVDCHFCYNANKNISSERKIEIDLESWKKVVDSIPFYTAISFTGGEAFLYPEIFALIKYIDFKKRKASVVSNGTTLSDLELYGLVDSNLHYLMFSLHGMERVHNRILGGKINNFEKTTNAIKRLNEIKKEKNKNNPVIGIKIVITNENFYDIPELMTYSEEVLGASHLYFNLISNEPFETFDSIESAFKSTTEIYKYPADKLDKILNLIDHIYEYKKTSKMDIGFTNDFRSKNELKNYIRDPHRYAVAACNKPFHEVYLQPNGDVTLCLKYKITNLSDINYNLKNLFKLPNYQSILTLFKNQKKKTDYCKSCLEASFETL